MKRALLLLCLLGLLVPASARAEDDGPSARPDIAWFRQIAAARAVASRLGRPIFIAVHPQYGGATEWPVDPAAWAEVYSDPRVVTESRQFACVLHLVGAPPTPGDPSEDGRPAVEPSVVRPVHLVVDASARMVLARIDEWTYDPGEPSVRALLELLTAALARADAIPDGTPLIGPAAVPEVMPTPGSDPLNPAGIPMTAPGIRVHLEWQLPVPEVATEAIESIPANVSFFWDGQGPFPLGQDDIPPGEDVDLPVDIRFADHEALVPLLTRGRHRVDVYIEPTEDGFRFSNGPLHVGLVWVELGDGSGGGGGGENQQEEPKPDEAPPPNPEADQPEPDDTAGPPPDPPKKEEKHVVEPFVRDGDMIEKDDAIVAVEDENAGVKPPPPMPAEASPREFEKMLERSVAWERIPPREREFLKRYFEALRQAMQRAEAAGGGK